MVMVTQKQCFEIIVAFSGALEKEWIGFLDLRPNSSQEIYSTYVGYLFLIKPHLK